MFRYEITTKTLSNCKYVSSVLNICKFNFTNKKTKKLFTCMKLKKTALIAN